MPLIKGPFLVPGTAALKRNVKGEITASRDYRMYFDPTDSDVYVSANLPSGLQLRTPDPSLATLVVTEVEVRQEGACVTVPETAQTPGLTWIARVSYGPWTDLFNSMDGNPLNQPPRVYTQSTWGVAEPVIYDTDGNPVTNTVGDLYDPPLLKNTIDIVLYVERNENPAQVNYPDLCANVVNHINLNDWNGFPKRTLKVCPIDLPKLGYSQQTGQVYYPMVYTFAYNPNTWDSLVPNMGYREFDRSQPSNGTATVNNPDGSQATITTYPVKNVTIEGDGLQWAVYLTQAGSYLPPPINQNDLPVNLHRTYKTYDFGGFGMNNLFTRYANQPPPLS